ncbi:RAMP superfamily protein [Peptococcaceae bacterium CEB3]|nr:RAMP superfamily protein [Peptococcaceae bacterium CEB3]
MTRKKLRILNISYERGKGIILGNDSKKYSFDLASESNQLKNQLTRGVEVEFTVVREGNPCQVSSVNICPVERAPAYDDGRYEKGFPSLETKEAPRAGQHRRDAEAGPSMNQRNPSNRSLNNNQGRRETATSSSETRNVPRYIPQDTRELLEKREVRFENYYLQLNKFPLVYKDEKKKKESFSFFAQGNQRTPVVENFKPFFSPCRLTQIAARQQETIQDLGFETVSFTARPEWRLVVGLGGASVYETSMTLHHIYGFPYLPGSAVKGVTRSWLLAEYFAGEEGTEGEEAGQEGARPGKAGQDEGLMRLFGGKGKEQTRKGDVIFFDALPLADPDIEVDVMTPHNSEYYGSKNKPPADYYEPVPVHFLTVGKKTEFRFTLAIRKEDNVEIGSGRFAGRTVLEVARTGLERALKEQGIGAKTAVGYGLMS